MVLWRSIFSWFSLRIKKNTFEEDHGTVALSLRTQAVVVKRITRKLNYILDNEIRLA